MLQENSVENDISNKYPELVEKLKVMIENHIIDIGGLLPIKNPNYNPNAESRMGIQSDFPIEKYPSY